MLINLLFLKNFQAKCQIVNTCRSFRLTQLRNFSQFQPKTCPTSIDKRKKLFLFFRRNKTNNIVKDPNKGLEKVKISPSEVRRLFSLAKAEKWGISAAIGCLIVSSSISMAVPFGLGKILDVIYSTNTDVADGLAKEKLDQFCLILCGIFIIGGIANFGRVYLFGNASLRITRDLRTKVYRTLLMQDTAWFDTKGTGELVQRLSSDTYLVGNSLSGNLSDGLRSTAMVLAGTGMMIHTSTHLALVGLCIVPCVAGMAIIYGRYVRNITKTLNDQYAETMKIAEERLGNVKTVKIFCREEFENQLFGQKLKNALDVGYNEVKARAGFYGMTGLSGNVIIVSVLYYGGTLVANNEMTVGALTSFILYAAYTAISIGGLSNFYTELNKGIGSASRLWEILDRKCVIPVEGGKTLTEKLRGEMAFENVTFNYPSRPDANVLKSLDLVVNPGEVTAVVGRSGSGKSTLAMLLLRLYDPLSGRVLLDGVDLKELNLTWLRCQIAAVNQEPVLFSGSIRDNILYGLQPGEETNEDYFQQVLSEANCRQFVDRLPDGVDTKVGQRGMMLSGGQKQRVAIARALIKNPSIMILDEATSALDAESEELIQKALENITKNRTVLTIAHRLSTIRNADQIVVLDNGRIVEQGSYFQLMNVNDGMFRELVQRQTFATVKTDDNPVTKLT